MDCTFSLPTVWYVGMVDDDEAFGEPVGECLTIVGESAFVDPLNSAGCQFHEYETDWKCPH